MPEDAVALTDVAAQSADSWYKIGSKVQESTDPSHQDSVAPIVAAFQYDFVEPTETERRNRWGPYGPMLELADGRVYPPPVDEVPEDWPKTWAMVAEQAEHAAARSRLHDLLWERKWGSRPDNHARSAIDAFEELAGGVWSPLDRAECLVRALELARSIGDEERRHRIVEKTIEAAHTSIQAAERQPGVALRLIESLMRLSGGEQPPSIDELLDEAASAYEPDPWILQTISDLQALRVGQDADRIRPIYLRQIERWRAAAQDSPGLVRLTHLESALELARVHGLRDVADELRKEIQDLSPEDMDLKDFSATIQIPREQVEAFQNAFLIGDWSASLTRFGSYGPPSGDYTKNIEEVQKMQEEHPLQFLFSKVILAPGNIPIRRAATEEEHREVELSAHEARGIAFWGISAADVLDRIHDEKAPPKDASLADFFTTGIIAPEVAERIARALVLYWEGQPDEASHLLVPRLEAVIREMCRQAGLAIIREPRGREPGGVRTLGDLLGALKGHLDESWRRYLVNLLVDPIGTNLRNRISHALLNQATREQAAALLHAACFLRLLGPAGEDQAVSEAEG